MSDDTPKAATAGQGQRADGRPEGSNARASGAQGTNAAATPLPLDLAAGC